MCLVSQYNFHLFVVYSYITFILFLKSQYNLQLSVFYPDITFILLYIFFITIYPSYICILPWYNLHLSDIIFTYQYFTRYNFHLSVSYPNISIRYPASAANLLCSDSSSCYYLRSFTTGGRRLLRWSRGAQMIVISLVNGRKRSTRVLVKDGNRKEGKRK